MKKPTILHLLFLEFFTFISKNISLLRKFHLPTFPIVQQSKNRCLSYALAMVGMLFFMSQGSYGQNLKPFNIRFDKNVKGDQLMIGNNILSQDNTNFNDKDSYNSDIDMQYVNIDSDPTTFSSSSAELTVPNSNAPAAACYKIVYAALYWSGIIREGDNTVDRTKFTSIKFKTPVGGYKDITGELIYDAINQSNGIGRDKNRPYACYADVTSLVQPLTDANGTYTVANVLSSTGYNSSTGLSAGWSLYIVYEDPKLPARSITSYDGFSGISGTTTLDITVSGFRTIPKGPVNASFAFAALEGDKKIDGDYLEINGVKQSAATATGTTLRPTDNFFNSSITYIDPNTKKTANFTAPNRTPASSNTLGYDAGIIELKNDNNSAIKNDATSAKITLGSTGDVYFYYFNAIAVEIIEPKIILTKKVLKGGVDAANQPVKLSEVLTYELQFQNVGNDNAKTFTIEDKLPANTNFNYPADIEAPLPAGVTHTYNATTRTITFRIPDNLVNKNGNLSTPIRFKVQVVPTCENLTEPCNNIIKNTAKSKYTGEINTNDGKGFGEDSYSSYSACTISVPESTNFLVGVDDCKKRNDVLCGDNVTISATGGYASYSWSTSPTGIPVIGTSQTLTVTKPGTYYVKNTATPPCVDLEEIITVADYAAKPKNPLIDIADNINPATGLIDKCVNDGSVLPKFFLCGNEAYKDINLSSLGATRITWEKTTCVPDPNLSDLCANVSPTCTWTTAIPDGNTFRADTAGQYRVSIYFGGCFSRFYFNVYKNELNYTVDKKDMICGKDGSITINGLGTNYEYSLSKDSGYQSSNTFNITTEGTYTVFIRQVGVATNPCIFEVKNIPIYKIVFNPIAPVITQPLCHDSKGSIKVYGTAYNGAQYTYELFKGGVSVEKVINSTASEYEFTGKDAGVYTYTVTTQDGCSYNGTAEIIAPAALTASPAITKPLTCENGEITVTPKNGTAPYYYYVNGSTTSQTDPKIVITTAGTYSIRVLDKNNCSYTIPGIKIDANPKPEFTVAGTNINCYGAKTGTIKFNVTNANGYTLAYSIDNGVTYVANGTFSDLPAGTYKPILRYTLSGVNCFETRPDINLTEPTTALSASAGVSELAGCGDGVTIPKNYGRVRITNPQGGVAPYEYSFDNQGTWSSTIMDAYKAPGTYTLYVKDANGCIFSAPVILDPEPAEPVIKATPQIDYNCDGTATSTVTVENPANASYTYEYYLDGVKNTNVPSNVFVNVSSVPNPHSIRVDYKLNSVPTPSNLLFENFGYGADVESPGINTTFYCFERQVVATQCRNSIEINDGDYSVTARIVKPFGPWIQPGDHTPQTVPPTPNGRCLVVNLGDKIGTTDVIYKKVIKDIIPNQPINFELFVKNLLNKTNNQIDCNLAVALVDATGKEIQTFTTGDVPKSELWEKYPKTPITLDPGNNTTLTFIIRSNKSNTNGNDVAIDDIKVFQLPKSCIASKSFPLTIDTGKAFTAEITGTKNVTCNGEINGEITISATNFDTTTGYQYSLDNGTNWDTTVLTTSPYTITNLGPKAYTVAVRPIGSTVTACTKTFPPVNISQPAPIVVNATKTKATCLTGATIDARSTTGGTPAYKFELINTVAPNTVIAFPANGVLPDVAPGTYLIKATDANSCSNPTEYSITIDAVPTISAAVVPSTAMCFDPTTGAEIKVEINGGVGPYSYQTSLNGGTFSASSATFTTLSFTHTAAVTGNYVFRVTDSNGCPAETAQQVINAKVTANAQVTTDLDCDPAPGSPDAVITGTISGGTAPFTVVLTSGQTTGTLAGPVGTATTFTYTTGVSGTYQFEITDAIGCKTTTSATINAKIAVTAKATVTDVKCNGENNGSVILEALTGVAPYTFAITAGTATTGLSTNTTANYSGLAPGTYKYTVTDKKNCQEEFSFEVKQPDAIEINASIKTPYTCDSEAIIEAIATKGNGGFTYVLKRTVATVETTVATNTTGLFPNLTVAGSYTVTATDAKGCPITSAAMPIVALTPPTAMTFKNTPVTCPDNKTDITIDTYTGGFGAVEYRISAPAAAVRPFQSGATFTNLDPGVTYRFEVRDAKNCLFSTTYSVPVLPTLSASGVVVSNVVCVGESNGSIRYTVGGFGNNTPYSYTIDGVAAGSASSPLTGSTFDILVPNLAAGLHELEITNTTTKCSVKASATVAAPSAPLAITPPTISPITCSKATASITINTTGGWGSNSYTVTGTAPVVAPVTQTTRTFNNLAVGDYTASVKDANGCIVSIPFTIAPYTALELTPTVTAACSVAGNTNVIVASATGGSGTYTYSINTGVAPTGALLNTFNVAPGDYIITVRDAFGCIDTETVTVSEVLTATAIKTKDITCSTPEEATIRVDVTGGKADFGYRVNIGGTGFFGPVIPFPTTGSSTLNYTALSLLGTSYQFEITDANGCTRVTNTVNTNTPTPVAATTSITNLTCYQSGNGVVTINPSAGVAPFEYNFNGLGFSNVSTYSNLAASTGLGYPYVVRDSKGCLFNGFAVVNQPFEIEYTVSAVNMKCDLDIKLGSITVSAITNGFGPFNYTLRNLITGAVITHTDPTGASFTFSNLSFGNFEVIVTDSKGCSKTISNIQVLPPPDQLLIDVSATADCTNGATIIVEVKPTVVPATPKYKFGIYDATTAPFTTNLLPPDLTDPFKRTFTSLTPGVTYTFVVYDENTDCYYFQTAPGAVDPLTEMIVSTPVENDVTCTGTDTGGVTFTLSNYDATTVNWEIFTNQTNVSTNVKGTVTTIAPTTVNVTTGLKPGTYYVKFTEVGGSYNGCTSASATFSITESPVLLDLNASATKKDNCNTNAGQIVGVANGGTAPYSFILNSSSTAPALGNPLWNSPSTFNVESGSYYVWVKDSRGCIVGEPVNVILDPSPVIALTVVNKCVAEGAFEILVTENTAGTGAYTISLDDSDFASITLPHTFTGLNSGPHKVIIKDANGCTDTKNITIAAPLKVTPFIDALPTCANNDGQVTLTASGGTGAGTYTYSILPVAGLITNTPTGAVISALPHGTYTITMRDTATPTNCTTTTEVTLSAPTAVVYTATPTAPSCTGTQGNSANGTIDIVLDATNVNPPYTYSITRTLPTPLATVTQDTGLFTGLTAGTYDILVSSARGCSIPDTVVIDDPSPVVASASASAFTCSPTNTPNVTIVTVSAAGGSGTYTFSSDGISYFPSNSIPADNKYAFDVIDTSVSSVTFYTKDANGCTDDIIVPITPFPKLISANATLGTQADCNTPTEIINVAITGGSTPTNFSYQVAIDGGNYGALVPITAGATSFTYPATSIGSFYEFKITDNTTGCSIISNAYTVPVFNTMTVTASAFKNVDCYNSATGQIEINIGNYTGAYTYTILKGGVSTTFTGAGNTTTNPMVLNHGLVAGTDYTVSIAQTAYPSCIKPSNTVIITQPAALDLSRPFVTVKNQNCNTTGAVVTVDDTKILGGKRDYTYVFVLNGSGALPPAGDFKSTKTATFATTVASTDTVVVWVKDANGCYSFVRVPISLDPMPTVTASVASQCPSPAGYTINAVGTGGVGTLEYSLDGISFGTSSSLSVTSPGDYDVWVKDANDCIAKTTGKVKIFEPLQLYADVALSTCTDADGVVTLTASGGSALPANYEYKIGFGGTYGSSNVFGGLAASATPYTFYVRDISTVPSCEKWVDVIMFLPNQNIDFVPVATPVTCNGDSDGTIRVNMAPSTLGVNDNPIYTYALKGTTIGGVPVTIPATGAPLQTSPLFSGLAAGTYTVTVTSGRGCSVSQPIDVDEPDPILVPTPTVVPFGCATGNSSKNATITVTGVTGGSNTYLQYEFIKVGNPIPVQKSDNPIYIEADFSGGSYIVNVYDENGCPGTSAAIDIDPFVQLDKVNVNVTRPITCNPTTEDITVSATTIGGPATNLEYTLVDIDAATGLKGGLYPQQTNTTGNFANLPVANYLITVKNLDTNCEIIGVHYVNEPNTFDLTIDNVVDVTCLNDTNGSARVTLIDRVPSPFDNAGPFDYTLVDALGNSLPGGSSTATGTVNLTNLAKGTYTITATLTNTPFCTVSKNFTIGGPNEALVIGGSHTEITCVTGNNDGSIAATASGGWPGGYEFQLEETLSGTTISAWSTTSTFNGLTAGNYVVKARDPRGCEVFRTVVLTNPTPIAFNAIPSTTLLTCKGDTSATITVSAPTGGQNGNYLYTLNTTSAVPMISSGPQADPVFSNLGAGTYTVTVTDGWGCGTPSAPIVINEPTEVVASLVLATTPTCNILSSITLSATGGTGTYTYSADSAFTVSANPLLYGTFATTTTILNVPVGTYRYYVRDVNGCVSVVSNDVKIEPLPVLKVDLDVQNAKINCKGDTNGVIVATATGGLGNYIYTLLDGTGNPIAFTPVQTTPGNFTQLPAGTYSVRVNSGVDCQVVSVSEVIEEPLTSLTASAVPTPITCNGAANGVITVTASGGTGAIKYAISPRMDQFFDTGVFDQLAPGTYQIIVQDANGCFTLLSEEITEPQPIFVNTVAGSEIQEVCFGDRNAAFDINITGGVAPYSVSIDNINGTYFTGTATQNVFAFNGLTGGDHTVYIKDFNGCTAEWLVALDKSVNLDPKASVVYGCEFNSPSNTVTVALDASVDPTLVDFALDGSTVFQASNIFKNVAPGFHTITARHLNTCEKITTSFEVIGYTQLTLTIADGGLNEIVATGAAGAGNYKYSFDGGNSFSTNNKFIFYKSGDYTVMVRDANGCEATATRYFEFIDIKIPNVFTPNGDGNNDTWLPTNTINYKDLTISIFDRYGRKIANLRVGQGWDGRYNSLELPTGDYWYILKLKNEQDDREFVGHFTLMR